MADEALPPPPAPITSTPPPIDPDRPMVPVSADGGYLENREGPAPDDSTPLGRIVRAAREGYASTGSASSDLSPPLYALSLAWHAMAGSLAAAQGTVAQTGAEVGAPKLGRDIAALPEAFPFGFRSGRPTGAVAEAQRAAVVRSLAQTHEAEAQAAATAARARTVEELRTGPKPEPPTGSGFLPASKTATEHIEDLEAFAHDEAAQDAYWEDYVANVHPKDALAELERLDRERAEQFAAMPEDVKAELEQIMKSLDEKYEKIERRRKDNGHQ